MRVALAFLCIGAVSFLLRVLVAMVKEWMRLRARTAKSYLPGLRRSRRGGELITMRPEVQRREFPRAG